MGIYHLSIPVKDKYRDFYSQFHILRLRCSHPVKRGRWGTEHTHFPKRFYGNAPESCTTSPTLCHYQCLHQLQNFNQARGLLESKQNEEAQKLDHKYNSWQIKMERNISRDGQEWSGKETIPFKKCFQ